MSVGRYDCFAITTRPGAQPLVYACLPHGYASAFSSTAARMNPPKKSLNVLETYPEEVREAADLLKQAVPLMVRHDIPPTPVHYALWYTYSRGGEPELNQRLDKIVKDFDSFPGEAALK